MPTYLSPGVYVEEVEAGSRPIEGVGTSVAAFVGLAAKGPVNEPTLVSNWTQFTETFGDFVENSYLAHAVYGWFLNGGGNCFIVRISAATATGAAQGDRATEAGAARRLHRHLDREGRALRPRTIELTVEPADGDDPPGDEFKLVVKVDGKQSETYDGVTAKAWQGQQRRHQGQRGLEADPARGGDLRGRR